MRLFILCLAACATLAIGCTSKNPAFCESDDDCTSAAAPHCDIAGQFGDRNQCTAAPTPDAGAGDAAPPGADAAVGLQPFNVALTGSAAGTVESNPAGIACPATCSTEFEAGTDVVLVATPEAGKTFVTWDGDCPLGFGSCAVSVAGPTEVTAMFASANETLWSTTLGDSGADVANDVAIDAQGGVVVVGAFSGTVDFGIGAPLTATAGTTDGFAVKFSSDGEPQWVAQLGGPGDRALLAVSIDQGGDAFVAGTRGSGVLLARLAGSDGTVAWEKDLPSTDAANARGIGVANGQVAVTGDLAGTIDFGGGGLTAATPGTDLFIAWYSDDGDYVRSAVYGSDSTEVGNDIAVSEAGDVIVTGFIVSNEVDFGGGPLTTFDFTDVFAVKFSSTGAHQWSRGILGNGIDLGFAVDVDAAGNVYLTGVFSSTIDFGGGSIAPVANGQNAFVASLDGATGEHRWSLGLGATSDGAHMSGIAIAASPRGRITVAGRFEGAVDFGGGTITAVGQSDLFVASYDVDSGAHVRSVAYGSTDDVEATNDLPTGIATDAAGRIVLVGSMFDTVSFGAGAITSAGASDGFVASFGP